MKFPRLFCLSALSLSIGLLVLPCLVLATESQTQKKGAVGAQLVSDAAAIEPGRPFTVALRLQHDPHWHSYWIAPGTGYPTSLAWTLPAGFTAGAIQWPTPHIVKDSAGTITGNGYEGEIFLLVEITPPATLAPGSTAKLAAVAEWLMCMDVCMPGDAKLEITLPVAATAQADPKWTQAIADARAKLPVASTGWDITASHDDKTATLRLTPKPGTTHQPADLHFFAADAFTDYTKTNPVTRQGDTWVITGPLDAAAEKGTKRLTGVLASSNGWSAGSGYAGLSIDVEFSGSTTATAVLSPDSQVSGLKPQVSPPAAAVGLPSTLFLAFLGGLILNLMPCVFPVLGIKVLGFVNQSGSDRGKVVAHGLVFSLGVLLSFWALAGLLLGLRAGGAQLGWGFQLQSPAFVFGMAAFLLVFALNLSGLFEVGLSATAVGGKLQMQQGYGGSFFTGVLATIVATPCSAPFLAPALGAALALPAFESILVFTAIATGLAAPYLLLSVFPTAVKLLPRPGAWMETFKQLMAFPLYATVGWLLWVLAGQTKDDEDALLLIVFGLVLIAMAFWVYGRFPKSAGRVGTVALLGAGLWLGWPKAAETVTVGDTGYRVTWEQWSPEAIAAARAAGRTVYVDFTARWCATCQTNKAAVFTSGEVLAELEKRNVLLLKADWTSKDPAITAELAKWGRSAVPFNLIYSPGHPEPVVLPELLTSGRVLEALDKSAP